MGFESSLNKYQKPKELPKIGNDDKTTSMLSRTENMSRTTGRSLEFYKQFLKIDLLDFENKKILNIGAGKSDINHELEKQNIHPEILINLDFAYKNIGESHGVFKTLGGKKFNKNNTPLNAVAGDMKHLPMPDESLDKVIYLWSLCWLKDNDKPAAINEAYRVCGNEGEIKIYPVSFSEKTKKLIDKYPFIKVSTPEMKLKDLQDANIQDGAFKLLKKFLFAGEDSGPSKESQELRTELRQLLSNQENILMEFAHRLRYGIEGKKIGTLTITKYSDTNPETFSQAIQELEENDLTL